MTKTTDTAKQPDPEQVVRRWVDDMVVDLNLCPFAKREVVNDRVHYVVEASDAPEAILETLWRECDRLTNDDHIETTIVIVPTALADFAEYNDFLSLVDDVIVEAGYEGIFQVASFHPQYQFAETDVDDVSNYTNRSPLPLLHILREASIERALNTYPDPDQIPERNQARLEALGIDEVLRRYQRLMSVGNENG